MEGWAARQCVRCRHLGVVPSRTPGVCLLPWRNTGHLCVAPCAHLLHCRPQKCAAARLLAVQPAVAATPNHPVQWRHHKQDWCGVVWIVGCSTETVLLCPWLCRSRGCFLLCCWTCLQHCTGSPTSHLLCNPPICTHLCTPPMIAAVSLTQHAAARLCWAANSTVSERGRVAPLPVRGPDQHALYFKC